MNLLALSLVFTILIFVVGLLGFIWAGGKKFFDIFLRMESRLNSIDTNMAFLISENNKEHSSMSKKIESHAVQLGTHEEWLKRHEEILNPKK